MEEIKYTIYKLVDPISDEVRYIGLTFNSLKQRLKSHCSEKSKSHKSNWISLLKSKGLKPNIYLIEEDISTLENAELREIFYIEKYKNEGHDLTNSSSGGSKNKKMSDETKKKMSDAQIERYKTYTLVISDETKSILSIRAKERFNKEDERNKLRISNKRYEDSKTDEQRLNDILIQNSKKVLQYDLDMNLIYEYPSTKNAEKVTGLNSGNISKCCKHKVSTVGGFIWRYDGDNSPMKPKYLRNKK